MKKSLIRLVLCLMLVGLISSCKTKKNEPCDYIEYEYAEVTILDIKAQEGSNEVKIEVTVDKSSLAGQIQLLGELKKTTYTRESVDRNKIKIGNRYSVQISEPKDKDCGEIIIGWRTNVNK